MSLTNFSPFGDPFRQMDRLTSQLLSGTRTPMGMPMDVWRSADGYHIDLDLPGIDPSSVDITVEKNVLTVRAERTPEFGPDDEVLVAERSQGNFTRQLQLGDALDAQKVQASYDNGVLCLTIPTVPETQPRRIEVQSSGGQQSIDIAGETAEQPKAASASSSSQGGQSSSSSQGGQSSSGSQGGDQSSSEPSGSTS